MAEFLAEGTEGLGKTLGLGGAIHRLTAAATGVVSRGGKAIAFLARLDHVSGQVFTLDSRMDRWT